MGCGVGTCSGVRKGTTDSQDGVSSGLAGGLTPCLGKRDMVAVPSVAILKQHSLSNAEASTNRPRVMSISTKNLALDRKRKCTFFSIVKRSDVFIRLNNLRLTLNAFLERAPLRTRLVPTSLCCPRPAGPGRTPSRTAAAWAGGQRTPPRGLPPGLGWAQIPQIRTSLPCLVPMLPPESAPWQRQHQDLLNTAR